MFGSHVANVLRRLRRLADAYGTKPRFVLTSATIANPLLAGAGADRARVRRSSTATARQRGEREVVMCNPPLLDEHTGRRASSLSEAASLFADLVAAEVRTICFARSRRAAELIYQFARKRLEETSEHADRITPYRAGYTPQQRREIERDLAERGAARAWSRPTRSSWESTSATSTRRSSVTFPGHRREPAPAVGPRRAHRAAAASRCTWRATTRSTSSSAAIPRSSSTGPWRRRSSTTAPRRSTCATCASAAYEGPLEPADAETLGAGMTAAADRLVAAGELRKRGGRYHPRDGTFPAAQASRCAPPRPTASRSSRPSAGELIGFVEAERAFSTVHPGAVYLHLGEPYEVEELDIDGRRALVRPARGRLLHAAQDRDRDVHRGDPRGARRARRARCGSGSCR